VICVSATWQCVLEEGHETNPQSSGPAETFTRPVTGDGSPSPHCPRAQSVCVCVSGLTSSAYG